jgi:LCP family protein required for cell wall assembly
MRKSDRIAPTAKLDRGAPPADAGWAPEATPRYGEGLPPDLVYPWDEPGKQPRRPRRGRLALRLVALAVVLLLLAVVVRLAVFVAAVSTAPLLSTHFWPFGGPRQANVLIMGYGGQGHDGAYLTDSMLLLHADLGTRQTAQISVPRDLWVQVPPDSGHYAKINSAYAYGVGADGANLDAGGQLATLKVSQVTGLPVDRWVSVDFQGFRALVDALGGVDITVARSFSAQYPANDDPAVNPNWITVSFKAGRQHMDGETAIRYARARYADTPAEASDFARSQRQELLVRAIGAKLKSPTSWWRFFAVLNALQPHLHTNLSPVDLATLALRANPGGSTKIALDDTNVLVNDTSADGQAILVPRGGDYGIIGTYIQQQLAAGNR